MVILETCKAFLVSNSLIFTGILVFLFILWLIGIRFIPNNKVGITEKVISSKKNESGGIIALNGETGFQADVLRGGIYIYPRFFYKIHMVNIITIPQGEIGYAFARDGKPLSSSQTLGRIVKSDSETVGFEDVRTFLNNDGQKGPQRLILREGTYAINLAQFIIITNQTTYYMSLNIPDEKSIGKYGHLRLNYLKEHKRGLYTELLISGTLKQHLIEIDENATKRVNFLIKQLAGAENINEELKVTNQLEWVQAMNNIKNRAEEIVFNEILYV